MPPPDWRRKAAARGAPPCCRYTPARMSLSSACQRNTPCYSSANNPGHAWRPPSAPRAPAPDALSSLEGEAGIGKTSAALEFVAAHRADAQVYVGGCEQLSTPEPLGPLRDIERDSRGRFAVSAASQLTTF